MILQKLTGLVLFAGWIPLAACSIGPTPRTDPSISRKLTAYSYIEEGKLILFVVGVEAAIYRLDAEYVPLLVAVGNRKVPEALQFTRESFYLMDPEGNRTRLASVSEITSRYMLQTMDQRILSSRGFLEVKFDFYTEVFAQFFPNPSGTGVAQDRVGVPRSTWFQDILYFPMPEGGLRERRFDLFMDVPQLEDPVFVTFEVPDLGK
jgi:hypothetical protein